MTVTTNNTEWKASKIGTAAVDESPAASQDDVYESVKGVLGYDARGIATPDQAWFWTAEWQERERYADKEIANGHTTPFETSDELFKTLGIDNQ